jgi:uncharacterized protein YidB (DUF937 family)
VRISSYSWCETVPSMNKTVNAEQLQNTIGRDLTDEERRRFGVPDLVPGTK